MNDSFGHPQSVVVLGGSSEIAESILQRLIRRRCRTVVLAGRDPEALAGVADRARAAGAEVVETVGFEATEVEGAAATVAECFAAAVGPVDLVLVAVGMLGDREHERVSPTGTRELVTVNFTWPAVAVAAAAERLRAQGFGRIVVLSSVAGVRVRRANYVYGAAKAGLDSFAQGLSEEMRDSGVRVQVVRPGFVFTKMSKDRRPAPFAVGPDAVAAAVVRGIERNQSLVWVPSLLRWAFLALRHLPRALWRRLPG